MGITELSYKADISNTVGIKAEAYESDLQFGKLKKYEFFMPLGLGAVFIKPYTYQNGVFVLANIIDIDNLYFLLNDISIYCKCILKVDNFGRLIGMSLEQANLQDARVISKSEKLGTLSLAWQAVKIGELERKLMLAYFNKFIKS